MNALYRQQGFTLVEVITVMVLLVALATITVKSTAQLAFDGRYQVTQDRYDKIKTAILGNPNQTINGHPSVSGFVADMGRLPNCLRELIDGYCQTTGYIGQCSDGSNTTRADCLSVVGNEWNNWDTVYPNAHCSDGSNLNQANCEAIAGNTWMLGICSNPAYATKTNCENNSAIWTPYVTLTVGWRNPYIETPSDPSKTNALSDGWGRTAQGYCSNPLYSIGSSCISNGWAFYGYYACMASDGTNQLPAYTTTSDCTTSGNNWQWIDDNYGWGFDDINNQLTIRSYGKDQTSGTTGENYDNDYPQNLQSTVNNTDWLSNQIVNVSLASKAIDANFTVINPDDRPSTQATCLNYYGATWTSGGTPQCVTPSEYMNSECALATGTWTALTASTGYCSRVKTFITASISTTPTNSAACSTASKVWSLASCSNSLLVSKTACIATNIWTTATSSCSNPLLTTEATCVAVNAWTDAHCGGYPQPVCLDLYYRNNGNLLHLFINPNPSVSIAEDGDTHQVSFTLPVALPMGQAAFRITDCVSSSPNTYPVVNRDFKIVDVFPNRSLNFDW